MLRGRTTGLIIVAAVAIKLLLLVTGLNQPGGVLAVLDTLTSVVLAGGGAYVVLRGSRCCAGACCGGCGGS